MWFLQARCGPLFTIINHNHVNNCRYMVEQAHPKETKPSRQVTLGISILKQGIGLTRLS